MEKGDYISAILRSKKTVFSFKDIVLLWRDSGSAVRVRVNYYVKNGDLYRIRQGLYAKDKNYDKFELATKIYTPAYVSFETVLGQSGITFQYYSQIFVASYLAREIIVDGHTFSYRKIKDSILTSGAGMRHEENYSIATPERAFLDVLYLNKDYYFDNLSSLNRDKVFEILPVYGNQRMTKKVKELFKSNQK
ncbi:MAG: hypothetical protein Q8M00_01285 [bacterium]|nr:hypothetical protein [bacterium]